MVNNKLSKREEVGCVKQTRTYPCEKKKVSDTLFSLRVPSFTEHCNPASPAGGLPFSLSIIPGSMVPRCDINSHTLTRSPGVARGQLYEPHILLDTTRFVTIRFVALQKTD